MLVIPAIDLKDGCAVRLYKGDYNQKTIYSDKPEEIAKIFEQNNADFIHIVDLDGAKDCACKNLETIKKIRNTVKTPIEIGGGIRNEETIKLYLEEIGIDRVILGTKAIEDKDFLIKMIAKYGNERIVVSVDVKDNLVSVSGWLKQSNMEYIEFIKSLEEINVKYIVVTDISKDGTLNGPNFEMYEKIKKEFNINFIVSGGVKDKLDVYEANKLDYYACIIGKAYYEGKINLEEVISCLKKD